MEAKIEELIESNNNSEPIVSTEGLIIRDSTVIGQSFNFPLEHEESEPLFGTHFKALVKELKNGK